MIYNIESAVKCLISGDIKKFELIEGACPAYFERECERLGWTFELEEGYNGWEVDWWATITTAEDVEIHVYGCMYYGTAELTI